MTKRKSVWIIEYGYYSDYRVIGPYSTEEYAQKIADKINASDSYDDARVVERVLDPGTDEMNKGYTMYSVDIRKDGVVEDVHIEESITNFIPSTHIYNGLNNSTMHATVYAKDAAHAVKIVADRRFQFIAQDRWYSGYDNND